ncbi:MAG TPA: hypothetical protein PKM54_13075 [Anaerolineales bacterium]|nr:hypothetical protein [Anaerolineales bacterium]
MIDNIDTEKRSGISAVAIGIVALLCCICVLVGGMVWYGYYAFTQAIPAISTFEPPTNDDPFFPVDPTEPVIEPELTVDPPFTVAASETH